MTDPLTYSHGATLPSARITLADDAGTVADLATAEAVTVRVGTEREAIIEKTTGVTVAAGIATVDWEPGELDTLDPGIYQLAVLAQIDGELRVFTGGLIIRPAVGPPVEASP